MVDIIGSHGAIVCAPIMKKDRREKERSKENKQPMIVAVMLLADVVMPDIVCLVRRGSTIKKVSAITPNVFND